MGQRQASRAGDAAVLVPENTPSGPKPLPACPGPQVQVQVLILVPSCLQRGTPSNTEIVPMQPEATLLRMGSPDSGRRLELISPR